MKSRIRNSLAGGTDFKSVPMASVPVAVGAGLKPAPTLVILLLLFFILAPLAPAVSSPDPFSGAGAVSLDYPLQSGWNMISVPLYTDPSPVIVFASLPGNWSLFSWDAQAGCYLDKNTATITLGRGYWLKPAGAGVCPVSGQPNTQESVLIPLAVGWNLIGNPYTKAIPWDQVQASRDGGEWVNLNQAVTNGWLLNVAYAWTGQEYKSVGQGSSFQPLAGYWCKAKVLGVTVSFPQNFNYSTLWGDLHAHTSYSDDARILQLLRYHTSYPPGKALEYARDTSVLDFVGITDHAEDLTSDEWADSKQILRDFQAANPDGPIPFQGFEYTNSTTLPGHGHRCVLFPTLEETQLPIAPIGYDPVNCPDPTFLWSQLGSLPYLDIPHHPAKGWHETTPNVWWFHAVDWGLPYVNAARQPLVEIYSVHGNSEVVNCEEPVFDFQVDSTVEAALQLWLATGNPGYKLGIVASTDNHLSHPGAVAEIADNVVSIQGPYTGGILAVLASEKTRQAIWEAIQAKRTYATSGPRIELRFTASALGQSVPMGGTLTVGAGQIPVYFKVQATGDTAPVAKIQLLKNGQVLHEDITGFEWTDTPTGPAAYRVKVWQENTPRVDENDPAKTVMAPERAWSSPIWVEK
ncbi:MAG: DUF3604 domain-containing protein [Coprothermobacterota bacterium]|nr:DUF3604 domain-containing protein [Coprothermobacterota bacterium]